HPKVAGHLFGVITKHKVDVGRTDATCRVRLRQVNKEDRLVAGGQPIYCRVNIGKRGVLAVTISAECRGNPSLNKSLDDKSDGFTVAARLHDCPQSSIRMATVWNRRMAVCTLPSSRSRWWRMMLITDCSTVRSSMSTPQACS